MSRAAKTLLVWLTIMAVFIAIYFALQPAEPADDGVREVAADVFYSDLDRGQVTHVEIDKRQRVYAELQTGEIYRAKTAYTNTLKARLEKNNIPIDWRGEAVNEDSDSGLKYLLIALGLVVLLVFVLVRRARQQGTSIIGLRKTTARLVATKPQVTWNDVGGADEAKRFLKDTVDFLQNPQRWEAAGARAPRGILLEGPPGFGKTMLAKALASEAKLPFFEVVGSEFVELFVGVGAARVRDLFEEAKKKAPCVIFIDELDAIGRKRGGGSALMHQEREQALDQMLSCLDGFTARGRVVVVAATNRADVLDPALLRPGRFDMILRVGDFSAADRVAILRVHTRSKPLAADVDLNAIAELAGEASGAELEQICNNAAMAAVHRGDTPPQLRQADLVKAVTTLTRKSTQLDKLDTFLAEASSGLAQPSSRLAVRIRLLSSETKSGSLIWGDPLSMKLLTAEGMTVLSRAQIVSITADASVEAVGPHDLLRTSAAPQPDVG